MEASKRVEKSTPVWNTYIRVPDSHRGERKQYPIRERISGDEMHTRVSVRAYAQVHAQTYTPSLLTLETSDSSRRCPEETRSPGHTQSQCNALSLSFNRGVKGMTLLFKMMSHTLDFF